MPEPIEDYHARILAAADDVGRLPLDTAEIPNWDIFPFESEGLVLKAIEPLADEEEPRFGEERSTCWCATADRPRGAVWQDDHWLLTAFDRVGVPVILSLAPRAHHDLTDLPPALAAEMGRLIVEIGAAIESLPSVARVHASKWGDGGAHLHWFFFARPTRMPQLRGTCLALWDDFLPELPADIRDDNVRAVVTRLAASYGGELVAPSIG